MVWYSWHTGYNSEGRNEILPCDLHVSSYPRRDHNIRQGKFGNVVFELQ